MNDDEIDNEQDNYDEEEDNQEYTQPRNDSLGYALRHPIQALKDRLGEGFSKFNSERKKTKKSLFKRIWAKIPLKVKIFLILAASLLVIIVVILIAIGDDTSKKAVSTRGKGVSKLNITDSSPQSSQFALELYNKYDSLIGFTTEELKSIYDDFLSDNSNKNAYLKASGTKKFGSSSGEKYTIAQELSLYEHIQRTEKYNFNKIKWKEFTHTAQDVDMQTELREDVELYVPVGTDDETYETILKTTSPYLLTQDIPLGFLAGMVAQSGGLASQASNTSEKFVYELIQEAMSRMTVHKYVLQGIKLKSFYDDYDKVTYNQNYTVAVYSNGFETVTSEENPVIDSSKTEHVTSAEEKIEGSESYNYETFWYVAEAFVYDRVINNTFRHILYSEDDVNNLRSPDNNTLIETQEINEMEEVISPKNVNSSGGIPKDDKGNNEAPKSYETRTYTYVKREGKKYIYEKEWKDKLSTEKSENKAYSYETAKDFNTKADEKYTNMKTDKSIIAEDNFNEKYPSGNSIFDNYTKDSVSLKLYGMSIVDLMNTNYGVFSKYTNRGKDTVEAITRSEMKSGYNQVKNILNNLSKKSGKEEDQMNFNSYTTGQTTETLPFVYGSSLGFKNASSAGTNSSNFISGSNLLKEYLRACEGIGYETDPASTKIVEQGEEKFYRVAKNGTVGYGVDLSQNPQWKTELEGQMNATITFGETLIPVDLVDAIEDRFMNEQLEKVESKWPDLKTYQKHALVVRMYNWPSIDDFANYYPSKYNPDTDDLYDTVSEEFKDNPTATNNIKARARKDSILYSEYLSTPNTGDNGRVSLEGRRFSEWCVFSLGYYDKLQRFYTEGGSTPVGDLVDANDNINIDKVNELQAWYEDNIFSGAFHADPNGGDFYLDRNCKWYSSITESYAKQVHPSQNGVIGGEYYDYDRTLADHKAVGKYFELGMFQCTWWSNARQAQYLTEMGYQGEIKFSTGDGRYTAGGFHEAYKIPLNTNYMQIRPHSVVSENGGGNGHTYFCEAVGKNSQGHKCIVISHCGSGHAWHGVDIIDLEGGHPYKYYPISGSVCLDDLL